VIKPDIEKIIVEREVADSDLALAIRRNSGGVEVIVESGQDADPSLRHLGLSDGKKVLLVRQFKGRAFKQCQGLKQEYCCCQLHTLADANNCAMECSYCVLQYYMNEPFLTVFANTGDLLAELESCVGSQRRRVFRVTTGELSDSLLLDPFTGSTRVLVPFFRELPNAILELKTKTNNVEQLLDLEHGRKTVISWSVNTQVVCVGEELKAASLEDRLEAAARVARRGYPVGFHLDPIVRYGSWRQDYEGLLDLLLGAVPLESIAWISLGTLRFPPELEPTMEARFPRSRLRYGEFISAPDGKMRYIRPLRVEMYRALVSHLRKRIGGSPAAPLVYLCMESPAVWKKVFSEPGPSSAELDYRFAESFRRRFPEADLPRPILEDYERPPHFPPVPPRS
jgi:spore photoproduct lyase